MNHQIQRQQQLKEKRKELLQRMHYLKKSQEDDDYDDDDEMIPYRYAAHDTVHRHHERQSRQRSIHHWELAPNSSLSDDSGDIVSKRQKWYNDNAAVYHRSIPNVASRHQNLHQHDAMEDVVKRNQDVHSTNKRNATRNNYESRRWSHTEMGSKVMDFSPNHESKYRESNNEYDHVAIQSQQMERTKKDFYDASSKAPVLTAMKQNRDQSFHRAVHKPNGNDSSCNSITASHTVDRSDHMKRRRLSNESHYCHKDDNREEGVNVQPTVVTTTTMIHTPTSSKPPSRTKPSSLTLQTAPHVSKSLPQQSELHQNHHRDFQRNDCHDSAGLPASSKSCQRKRREEKQDRAEAGNHRQQHRQQNVRAADFISKRNGSDDCSSVFSSKHVPKERSKLIQNDPIASDTLTAISGKIDNKGTTDDTRCQTRPTLTTRQQDGQRERINLEHTGIESYMKEFLATADAFVAIISNNLTGRGSDRQAIDEKVGTARFTSNGISTVTKVKRIDNANFSCMDDRHNLCMRSQQLKHQKQFSLHDGDDDNIAKRKRSHASCKPLSDDYRNQELTQCSPSESEVSTLSHVKKNGISNKNVNNALLLPHATSRNKVTATKIHKNLTGVALSSVGWGPPPSQNGATSSAIYADSTKQDINNNEDTSRDDNIKNVQLLFSRKYHCGDDTNNIQQSKSAAVEQMRAINEPTDKTVLRLSYTKHCMDNNVDNHAVIDLTNDDDDDDDDDDDVNSASPNSNNNGNKLNVDGNGNALHLKDEKESFLLDKSQNTGKHGDKTKRQPNNIDQYQKNNNDDSLKLNDAFKRDMSERHHQLFPGMNVHCQHGTKGIWFGTVEEVIDDWVVVKYCNNQKEKLPLNCVEPIFPTDNSRLQRTRKTPIEAQLIEDFRLQWESKHRRNLTYAQAAELFKIENQAKDMTPAKEQAEGPKHVRTTIGNIIKRYNECNIKPP